MKRKIIIAALALIATIFVLAGCTAAPKSGGQYGSNGQHINANQAVSNAQHGGYGRQNAADLVEAPKSDIIAEKNDIPATASQAQEVAAAALTTDAELTGFGSAGALSDSDLNLAAMLTYALQDEYFAHAQYVLIIDSLGNTKPFSSIINAEEKHIAQLLPLFETYGIAPPEDNAGEHTAIVGDLTQAYGAGEAAELSNIAMYDVFLQQDLPDDVRTEFNSLKNASENHLAAFRKHL